MTFDFIVLSVIRLRRTKKKIVKIRKNIKNIFFLLYTVTKELFLLFFCVYIYGFTGFSEFMRKRQWEKQKKT